MWDVDDWHAPLHSTHSPSLSLLSGPCGHAPLQGRGTEDRPTGTLSFALEVIVSLGKVSFLFSQVCFSPARQQLCLSCPTPGTFPWGPWTWGDPGLEGTTSWGEDDCSSSGVSGWLAPPDERTCVPFSQLRVLESWWSLKIGSAGSVYITHKSCRTGTFGGLGGLARGRSRLLILHQHSHV